MWVREETQELKEFSYEDYDEYEVVIVK